MQKLELSKYVEGVVRWHHEPNPERRQSVGSIFIQHILNILVHRLILNLEMTEDFCKMLDDV